MKEVTIQNEYEGLSDDKGSETKILYMGSKELYDELEQKRLGKKNSFKNFINNYFNKLFIIRFMLGMAFLTFFYYLFLLIKKSSKIYKSQYSIFIFKKIYHK